MTALTFLAVATLAAGLSLVWGWMIARRPTLDGRLAPYVRPAEGVDWVDRTGGPRFALARLAAPVVRDVGQVLERWGSSAADVGARLERAGSTLTVEQFRAQQVAWAAAGLTAGFAAATTLRVARGASIVTLLVLVLVCALGGALARDVWLSRQASLRTARIIAELPTVADLVALAVAAGEGARGALERVASTTSGALPH